MKTAVAVVFAACGLLLSAQGAFSAEARLTSSEIRNTVVGHLITVVTPEGKTGPLLAAAGGNLRSRSGHADRAGKWWISGDQFCFDPNGDAGHDCVTVVRRGHDKGRLFLFTSSGTPFGELLIGNSRLDHK